MTADAGLVILVVLPALVGAGLALLRPSRGATTVSLLAATVVLALAVLTAALGSGVEADFMAGARLGLEVDGPAALFVPTIAAVTLLVLVFAAADLRSHPGGGAGTPARFHGLMLLFAAAALMTATATTLPTLLMGWEVMGATSYALIGFGWREQHRVSSGLVAFVTTRTADLGLYVAAGAALAGGAGWALSDLDQATPGWRHVIAAGIAVAALGKAAQLPLSFWLSRAMDGPSPVSALLHSAAMVALGGFVLLRAAPLLAATGWADQAVAWVGALTAVALGAVAVAQTDLKQLLAASTAAQLGYVVLAAGVGAVSGGVTDLVGHAAVKALLFLVAGAWLTATGTSDLGALAGSARRWPLVGAAAVAGLLALAGIAPLTLWATKDDVLAGALEASPALYVVGLAGVALSACYAGKVLLLVCARRPAAGSASATPVPRLAQVALVPLALGALTLGLLAFAPVDEHVRRLLHDAASPSATTAQLVGSAVIALVALAGTVTIAAAGRRPASQSVLLARWLLLEPAAHRLVAAPTFALANLVARADDQVLDRAVDGVASATTGVARIVRSAELLGVDRAVRAVARAVRFAGSAAPSGQTGQLGHYYLQVVVALGVMVLVLVAVSVLGPLSVG